MRAKRLLGAIVIASLTGVGCGSDPSGRAEPTPGTAANTPPTISSSTATNGEPNDIVELSIDTHCGVGVLSKLVDGYVWRTSEADGADWVPLEWYSGSVLPDPFVVSIWLSGDGEVLTATHNGRDVTYVRDGQAFTADDQCA